MSLTQLGAAPSRYVVARGEGADNPKPVSDYLSALAKFIPGDVLAAFLTFEAALRAAAPYDATSHKSDWAIGVAHTAVFVGMELALAYVVALRYLSTVADPAKPKFVWPIWPAIGGAIAFVVYALETDTVWYLTPSAPASKGFSAAAFVILTALVLPLVNLLMPKSQQV